MHSNTSCASLTRPSVANHYAKLHVPTIRRSNSDSDRDKSQSQATAADQDSDHKLGWHLLQVVPVDVAQLLECGGHEDGPSHAALLLSLDQLVQQQVGQVVVPKVVGAHCGLHRMHSTLSKQRDKFLSYGSCGAHCGLQRMRSTCTDKETKLLWCGSCNCNQRRSLDTSDYRHPSVHCSQSVMCVLFSFLT